MYYTISTELAKSSHNVFPGFYGYSRVVCGPWKLSERDKKSWHMTKINVQVARFPSLHYMACQQHHVQLAKWTILIFVLF